jgi:hypothetical protein
VVEALINGIDPGRIVEVRSRPCHHPIRAASNGFCGATTTTPSMSSRERQRALANGRPDPSGGSSPFTRIG